MLDAADRPHGRAQRIIVAGVSGSGKTTLAARIADLTGLPHTEIDSLYHGENWTPRPSFVHEVDRFTTEPRWVTEWQYRAVRQMLAERADTVVWLDLPFRVTLARVIRRTVRRRLTNEVLWNGNREGPLLRFFVDRDHIVRWAIRTRNKYRAAVRELESTQPHLQIVRLRSQREVETWLDTLTRP